MGMTSVLLLGLALTGPAASAPAKPVLQVIRATAGAPRYVRLNEDVDGAGVRGTATLLVDLATGRTAEHIDAGPLSSSDGFDGVNGWSADATGMAMIESNAEDRRDALAWAHLFGRRGPEHPTVRQLTSDGRRIAFRVRYAGLSGPIDVVIDRQTGRVARIDDYTGVDAERTVYADYRRMHGLVLPFASERSDVFGTWRARVRTVAFPNAVPAGVFEPPPPPNDTRLTGVSTVTMSSVGGTPVVPIRIDDGPVMHVLFDTGATNYLTPAAALRLRLHPVGNDKSGGVGAKLVRQRYATVKRLRIGNAVMTNQPFAVVEDDSIPAGIDGVIGQEVLQRFAVRFDFARGTVRLARDVRAFRIGAQPIVLHFARSGPEVDGTLDGLPGAIAIDTGSDVGLDVMVPFVRKHDLVRRYGVKHLISTGSGIGGGTVGYLARAHTLRVGSQIVHDVPIALNTMAAGAFNDPTQLGNLGAPLLRRFVTVFDYRNARLWLLR